MLRAGPGAGDSAVAGLLSGLVERLTWPDRLARAVNAIEAQLPFATHERYGCLSSCPTNLGTAMRASVHVRLPNLAGKEATFGISSHEGTLLARRQRPEHSEHRWEEGGHGEGQQQTVLACIEFHGTSPVIDF